MVIGYLGSQLKDNYSLTERQNFSTRRNEFQVGQAPVNSVFQ